MNVATLRLEMTLHFHLRTSKISGGISIFMSRLTLTWQASRQPRLASPRLMKPVSVGSRSPPPSLTITSQTPQAPLPPQAEGMKILLLVSVSSSVPPAGVFSALPGSSLIRIETSPCATSLRLAASRIATSSRITAVNIAMPVRISFMAFLPVARSELDAREHHEGDGHQPRRDEGDAEAAQAVRHVGVDQSSRGCAASATIAIAKPSPDPRP